MPQLCGCLHSVEPDHPTSQTPAYPGAGFMHRADSHSQPPRYDSVDSGYTPVVPLPRYTPRPVSMHEKSIGNTFHEQQQQRPPNEKNSLHFEEPDAPLQAHSTGGSSTVTVTATMDDASSAYSFPSSFGHTSTETRDTPPPPYSSCGGSLYSRSRASSMRSSRHSRSDSLTNNHHQQQTGSDFVPATTAIIAPPPMAHIGNNSSFSTFAPSMTYTSLASRQAGSPNQRRFSWESR